MFNVNNKNTKTVVNVVVLKPLLQFSAYFRTFPSVSIVDFEQVIAGKLLTIAMTVIKMFLSILEKVFIFSYISLKQQ